MPTYYQPETERILELITYSIWKNNLHIWKIKIIIIHTWSHYLKTVNKSLNSSFQLKFFQNTIWFLKLKMPNELYKIVNSTLKASRWKILNLAYNRRKTRDKRPLGRDPDRGWFHRHSHVKLLWSQPMNPWTSAAAYEWAAFPSQETEGTTRPVENVV